MGTLPDTAIYSEQEKYCHNTENDSGTHTHFVNERKKGKKTIYENKLKYEISEAIFKDKDNWKTGDFYYKTGVKTIYGIIATITAGKSISWKLSKE